MNQRQINELLTEVAPLIDAGAVTACQGPDIWVVEFAGEQPCFLTPCARDGHWVLSGAVADLPEKRREALFKLLLLYNDHGAMAGGPYVGLDGDDGAVTIALHLSTPDMSPTHLSSLIGEFRDLRRHWQDVVRHWPTDDASSPSEPERTSSTMLRV
jgi:hypothetical protein